MRNELESINPITDMALSNAPVTSREITIDEKQKLSANLSNARSENTRKNYMGAWDKFTKWCETESVNPLPSEPWQVALYVDYLNESGYKESTLNTAVSAIQAMHSDNGYTVTFFTHHLVKSTLTASKRAMADDGRSKVNKPAVFTEQLMKDMLSLTSNTVSGVRDKAMLALGFNTGMRASEISALLPSDIEFDGHGMTVTIRRSKGDQMGKGDSFYIQALAPIHADVCAVHNMRQWLEVRGGVEAVLRTDTPIFFALRKGVNPYPYTDNKGIISGLSRQAITKIVAGYAKRLSITGNYSAHSLRHSFITLAFSKGIQSNRIAKVTRHKNQRVLQGYDQTGLKDNSFNLALWG
ncbi:tyrosine-type recombinase/integrase [Glutamicibacter ardleyensis]|uniref:tyrosine-type recombinase/integrase n=1 Tax=Glutamicibacter ardleyensis TaxID=225894 RepID=UPI003FD43B43